MVGFSKPYASGTIVVKTSERALYYVLGNGSAVRYPVGVWLGRQAMERLGQDRRQAAEPGLGAACRNQARTASLRCQP